MRIYPHLQDSGGFFIAVLQRKRREFRERSVTSSAPSALETQKRSIPDEDEESGGDVIAQKKAKLMPEAGIPTLEDPSVEADMEVDQTGTDDAQIGSNLDEDVPEKKNSKGQSIGPFKENPFTFIPADESGLLGCMYVKNNRPASPGIRLTSIISFSKRLRLSDNFPSGNMYVRNPIGEPTRSLYLVNDAVKAVMQNTDYTRIRLMSAGVKMFGRAEFAKVV